MVYVMFELVESCIFEGVFKIEPYPKRTGKVVGGKFPHLIKNERTRLFEASIQLMAKQLWRKEPIKEAIRIEVSFFMSKPKSVNRDVPCVKPDLSNLIKSFEDGCNGVIWEDDSLICGISAKKEYSSDKGFIVLKVYAV